MNFRKLTSIAIFVVIAGMMAGCTQGGDSGGAPGPVAGNNPGNNPPDNSGGGDDSGGDGSGGSGGAGGFIALDSASMGLSFVADTAVIPVPELEGAIVFVDQAIPNETSTKVAKYIDANGVQDLDAANYYPGSVVVHGTKIAMISVYSDGSGTNSYHLRLKDLETGVITQVQAVGADYNFVVEKDGKVLANGLNPSGFSQEEQVNLLTGEIIARTSNTGTNASNVVRTSPWSGSMDKKHFIYAGDSPVVVRTAKFGGGPERYVLYKYDDYPPHGLVPSTLSATHDNPIDPDEMIYHVGSNAVYFVTGDEVRKTELSQGGSDELVVTLASGYDHVQLHASGDKLFIIGQEFGVNNVIMEYDMVTETQASSTSTGGMHSLYKAVAYDGALFLLMSGENNGLSHQICSVRGGASECGTFSSSTSVPLDLVVKEGTLVGTAMDSAATPQAQMFVLSSPEGGSLQVDQVPEDVLETVWIEVTSFGEAIIDGARHLIARGFAAASSETLVLYQEQ